MNELCILGLNNTGRMSLKAMTTQLQSNTIELLPSPRSFTSFSTQTQVSIRIHSKGFNTAECKDKINPKGPSKTNRKKRDSVENEEDDMDNALERRLNPESREDFRRLNEEVEKWRDSRLKEIEDSNGLSDEHREEQRALTLCKETKLLRKIDDLNKIALKGESKRKLDARLDAMSGDDLWEMSSGEKIVVETSSRKYASKLVDLYKKLSDFDNQNGKFGSLLLYHCLVSVPVG